MSESNHQNAMNAIRLQKKINNLRCPKCDAANRPGLTYIELEHGRAACNSCGADWKDEESAT
jgi:transposase-like protein